MMQVFPHREGFQINIFFKLYGLANLADVFNLGFSDFVDGDPVWNGRFQFVLQILDVLTDLLRRACFQSYFNGSGIGFIQFLL